MKTNSLAIVGCGKLGEVVADAFIDGLLNGYKLVATLSRTIDKARYIADKVNKANYNKECVACNNIDELLALKPNYIVETATPAVFKNFALKAITNGASIVTLSIGALADEQFYRDVEKTAHKYGVKVHIPSGAIGGLDLMRTATLMGETKVRFDTEKSWKPLRGTQLYDEKLETMSCQVFNGNAKEAIAILPTQVNVAVAASLATVGTENVEVTIATTPHYKGDKHTITLKNSEVDATLDIYSQTSNIAGWSVVHTLRNIASSIVFG